MACYMFCKRSRSPTSLCIRPSEIRPSGFFPSPSENLGSLVTGEIFNFTRSLWFLRCTFHKPSMYHSCMFERQNNDLTEGATPRKIYRPGDVFFFSKTQWDLSLGLFERGVFFQPIEKKMKGVFSKSYDAASMQKGHTKICLSELIRIKFVSWKDHETSISSVVPSSEWRFSFETRHDTLSV